MAYIIYACYLAHCVAAHSVLVFLHQVIVQKPNGLETQAPHSDFVRTKYSVLFGTDSLRFFVCVLSMRSNMQQNEM